MEPFPQKKHRYKESMEISLAERLLGQKLANLVQLVKVMAKGLFI